MMLVPFLGVSEGWSTEWSIKPIEHSTHDGVRPGWTQYMTKTRGELENKHVLGTLMFMGGARDLH